MVLKVARGGAGFVVAPVALGIPAVALVGLFWPTWLLAVASAFVVLFILMLTFFRDPDRPAGPGIVSAADGKVNRIDEVDDPDVGPAMRLSVFMRPMDVHVNRLPMTAEVVRVTHHPGGHVPAFSKDSDRNERVETLLRTEIGLVKVVQIAGTVARRIVPYLQPGDAAEKGDRMGLIRLSSRCDIIVPRDQIRWTVSLGKRVFAGVSPIAEPRSAQEAG